MSHTITPFLVSYHDQINTEAAIAASLLSHAEPMEKRVMVSIGDLTIYLDPSRAEVLRSSLAKALPRPEPSPLALANFLPEPLSFEGIYQEDLDVEARALITDDDKPF